MYDEHIKSRLIKDIRFFREIKDQNDHKVCCVFLVPGLDCYVMTDGYAGFVTTPLHDCLPPVSCVRPPLLLPRNFLSSLGRLKADFWHMVSGTPEMLHSWFPTSSF